jgi:hypothetical protein
MDMENVNFNELAKRVYENAKRKGFHDVERKDDHWLMLVVCELAEAVEADRSGRRADRKEYERLVGACEEIVRPHLFEMYVKDSVEDELADAVIRLLDFMGMKGTNVDGYLSQMDLSVKDFGEGMKKPFTDEVFGIIQQFFYDGYEIYFMCDIFGLAQRCDIDLMWFIYEKMKYNETREVRHGKEY